MIIRSDAESAEAKSRLHDECRLRREQACRRRDLGLRADELERALGPLRSFQLQLEEGGAEYERSRRGHIGELVNLHGLRRALAAPPGSESVESARG